MESSLNVSRNPELAQAMWRALVDLKNLNGDNVDQAYAQSFLRGLAHLAEVPADAVIASIMGTMIDKRFAAKLCVSEWRRKKFGDMDENDVTEYCKRLADFAGKTVEEVREMIRQSLCDV